MPYRARSLTFQPALAFVVAVVIALVPTAPAFCAPPVDLKFGGFFRQPVGPRGLEFSDALRGADGARVRLVGYMVAQEQPMTGRFMLTPRPVRMSEHADGEADDLPPSTVTVLLDAGQRARVVAHQAGLIALTGKLEVGRQEDSDGRVSWVRLVLDRDAVVDAQGSGAPDTSEKLPSNPSR